MRRLTFLPFVEDGWARMIMAFLIRISEHLPTRLVYTFLRHVELSTVRKKELSGNGATMQCRRLNVQGLPMMLLRSLFSRRYDRMNSSRIRENCRVRSHRLCSLTDDPGQHENLPPAFHWSCSNCPAEHYLLHCLFLRIEATCLRF